MVTFSFSEQQVAELKLLIQLTLTKSPIHESVSETELSELLNILKTREVASGKEEGKT